MTLMNPYYPYLQWSSMIFNAKDLLCRSTPGRNEQRSKDREKQRRKEVLSSQRFPEREELPRTAAFFLDGLLRFVSMSQEGRKEGRKEGRFLQNQEKQILNEMTSTESDSTHLKSINIH